MKTPTSPPSSLKKKVLSQILPNSIFHILMFIPVFSFCVPLFIFVLFPTQEFLAYPVILITACLLFILFSSLDLFILIQFKNPYMQELKDLFGYVE